MCHKACKFQKSNALSIRKFIFLPSKFKPKPEKASSVVPVSRDWKLPSRQRLTQRLNHARAVFTHDAARDIHFIHHLRGDTWIRLNLYSTHGAETLGRGEIDPCGQARTVRFSYFVWMIGNHFWSVISHRTIQKRTIPKYVPCAKLQPVLPK